MGPWESGDCCHDWHLPHGTQAIRALPSRSPQCLSHIQSTPKPDQRVFWMFHESVHFRTPAPQHPWAQSPSSLTRTTNPHTNLLPELPDSVLVFNTAAKLVLFLPAKLVLFLPASCHGPHLTQNKTQLLSMTLTSRDLNDLAPHHHSDSIPCHSLHPLLVPKHTSFTPGPLHMFPLPGTLFLQMYVACHLNSFSSAQRSHFQRDYPWPLYFNWLSPPDTQPSCPASLCLHSTDHPPGLTMAFTCFLCLVFISASPH